MVISLRVDEVCLLLSRGLVPTAICHTVGDNPVARVTADVDDDGSVDVVVAKEQARTVSVLLNNGAGDFAPAVEYSVGNVPVAVVASDVDRDNDVDLVVAMASADMVSVLFNNGRGVFSLRVNYALSVRAAAQSMVSADLDNDGDTDWVRINFVADDGFDRRAVLSLSLHQSNGSI